MTDLTPNHPAVEAALIEHRANATRHATGSQKVRAVLRAALPHLTADDLRNTPAGKQLMAEGLDALIESMSASGEFHDVDLRTMQRLNPYLDGDA